MTIDEEEETESSLLGGWDGIRKRLIAVGLIPSWVFCNQFASDSVAKKLNLVFFFYFFCQYLNESKISGFESGKEPVSRVTY